MNRFDLHSSVLAVRGRVNDSTLTVEIKFTVTKHWHLYGTLDATKQGFSNPSLSSFVLKGHAERCVRRRKSFKSLGPSTIPRLP